MRYWWEKNGEGQEKREDHRHKMGQRRDAQVKPAPPHARQHQASFFFGREKTEMAKQMVPENRMCYFAGTAETLLQQKGE